MAKAAIPLSDTNRERLEAFLADDGYKKLMGIAVTTRTRDAEVLVQNTLARASDERAWKCFDQNKGGTSHVVEKIMYGLLVNEMLYNDFVDPLRGAMPDDDRYGVNDTGRVGVEIDVAKAIGSLEEPYRSVAVLIAVKEWTLEEVGAYYGFTRQQAHLYWKAARQELQERLAAYADRGDSRVSDSTKPETHQPSVA